MSTTRTEPGALERSIYDLGTFIELHHFLALPGERRYARDEEGRLTLMSPDDLRDHRFPLNTLTRLLHARLALPYEVAQECAVAFDRIYDLRREPLPASFLGPKTLVPDVCVFDRVPEILETPSGLTIARPSGVRLVIEIVSRDTWRSDLGVGQADDVDKKRSYLESGVPEYWVLNAGVDEAARHVGVRSGLFLSARPDRSAWDPIPVSGDRVSSRAVPELEFDLAEYWAHAVR